MPGGIGLSVKIPLPVLEPPKPITVDFLICKNASPEGTLQYWTLPRGELCILNKYKM